MVASTFEDYQKVYGMLGDQESREIYINRLNWLITGDQKYTDAIVNGFLKTTAPYQQGKSVSDLRRGLPEGEKFVLYGAGKFAEYFHSFWKDDQRLAGYCCQTKAKQANGYLGFPVMSPEELLAQRELNVVINTARFRNEILQILRDGGYPQERIFDVTSYICWEDSEGQYFDPELMRFEDGEVYIDAGCMNLDTSLRLKKHCGHVKKVYAFEPDAKNYQVCLAKKEETGFREAEILPYGTWSSRTELRFCSLGTGSSCIDSGGDVRVPVVPVDEVVDPSERITTMKMDVEGAELESLKGARNTILRDHPKLAICVYHKPEDLTEIPLYIKELVPEYQLYLRHYSNNWLETVLYAVMP